jgi:WD40 repeat protein
VSRLKRTKTNRFTEHLQRHDRQILSDYITGLAWSPDGTILAASSASGEVVLWQETTPLIFLQPASGFSVDCLAFSGDGQFLAAGGQDGTVKVWHLPAQTLISTQDHATWVNRLPWNPSYPQLAMSLGRTVSVWDAVSQTTVASLNFEASSVFDISWHPQGEYLAACGYQGAKVWNAGDWQESPYLLENPAAGVTLAWSGCGRYIAQGNLDNTLTVVQWNSPHPWQMRGFPGKVRALAWCEPAINQGVPLLATASSHTVIIWEKQPQDSEGWAGWVLERHLGIVNAIAFQPHSLLLASAGEDGLICLWQSAKHLVQVIEEKAAGFSCLAWHPQGNLLAAGGENGALLIWSKSLRGQGFG